MILVAAILVSVTVTAIVIMISARIGRVRDLGFRVSGGGVFLGTCLFSVHSQVAMC